jgi:hypothetical protein
MKLLLYHNGRLFRLALSYTESEFVMVSHRHSIETGHAILPNQICIEMLVAGHPFANQLSRGCSGLSILLARTFTWLFAAPLRSLLPQIAALSEPATSALTPHAKPRQQHAASMPRDFCGVFWICIHGIFLPNLNHGARDSGAPSYTEMS